MSLKHHETSFALISEFIMKKQLTLQFTLHQMSYWASAAGIMSFATAFLLAKGFAATQVGTLLAFGSLLSCVLQPLLANHADQIGGNILKHLVVGLTALCILCFAVIQLTAPPKFLFGLLYLMAIFTFDSMMPLLNSICVSYTGQGYQINYGFGRGIGSLAYSFAALLIGKVIAGKGIDWMLWIVLFFLMIHILITLSYPGSKAAARSEKSVQTSCSLLEFFKRYKWYCVSLLGVMMLAMFHAMTENYLIEVMGRLGGNSSNVGTALFIATVAEMPVILWFNKVRKHIPDTRLLKLAGLSFFLKSLLLIPAPGITSIYLIQLLQATSYGFLSPTQLYYANSRVSDADMVKGQAFITVSYTLGCAIGNFTGGVLLDSFHVMVLLGAGIVMAALGALILFLTVDKKPENHLV